MNALYFKIFNLCVDHRRPHHLIKKNIQPFFLCVKHKNNLFYHLFFSCFSFQRPDNDLVFDDSTFSDDKLSAVNTNHENLRTKLVSKRSVSDFSDSNNDNDVGLWQRLKRGIKSLFGYKSEESENSEVEIPKVEELRAVPAVIPAQKSNSLHETSDIDNGSRRRRQHDDEDDEDDDDEDNEINGSGEHETTSDNDVEIISTLPDVTDAKYCEFLVTFLTEDFMTFEF